MSAPAARPAPLRAADLPEGIWRASLRIRFSHCDPAGIVYFARWFDLLNGVVEDWFSGGLGLDYHGFIRDRRIGLGYGHAGADYMRPGLMGDEIACAVLVERIGRSSLTLRLPALRGDEPVLDARLVIVTTDLDRHRATPLPDELRGALERYRAACG